MKLTLRLKGGEGSGHHGHAGRPGDVGGSVPGVGGGAEGSALEFVKELVISGGPMAKDRKLSSAERGFLAQTVTKKSYKLYRGLSLVKGRVSPENIAELNALKPGDPVPDFLMKTWNPYASYSKKVSVARGYSQGKVSVVIEARIPATSVIADLQNLKSVLAGSKQTILDSYDFDYFAEDKEVIVREPIQATIRSITGKMPVIKF